MAVANVHGWIHYPGVTKIDDSMWQVSWPPHINYSPESNISEYDKLQVGNPVRDFYLKGLGHAILGNFV